MIFHIGCSSTSLTCFRLNSCSLMSEQQFFPQQCVFFCFLLEAFSECGVVRLPVVQHLPVFVCPSSSAPGESFHVSCFTNAAVHCEREGASCRSQNSRQMVDRQKTERGRARVNLWGKLSRSNGSSPGSSVRLQASWSLVLMLRSVSRTFLTLSLFKYKQGGLYQTMAAMGVRWRNRVMSPSSE